MTQTKQKIFSGRRQTGKTTQLIQTVARDFNPVSGEKILFIGYKAEQAEYLVSLLKHEIMRNDPYGLSTESINKIVEGVSIEEYLNNLDSYSNEFQYIVLDNNQLILERIFPSYNLYSTFLVDKNVIEVNNILAGKVIDKIYNNK